MLDELIESGKSPLLNIYFTAGFPTLDSIGEIMRGLERANVDIVEIGIPYSDPLSDGPTIQNSHAAAIKNGITIDLIFEHLSHCSSRIPRIIMGYFNSIFVYGIERFCKKCHENAIGGVIFPDLPIEIYQEKYRTLFEKYNIAPIFLITPQTSEKRIRYIDSCSSTFIYAVSSSSTTGKGKNVQLAHDYLSRLRDMELKNPIMVGFNISSKSDFDFVTHYASGGIIGSAFIRHITDSTSIEEDTIKFIESVKTGRL